MQQNGKRKSRPVYSSEFRSGAVELIRGGKSVKEIAYDLGVSEQSLRNWDRQFQVDEGKRAGLKSDERLELGKLRRRVKELEMEQEILKKASAFFAKEMNITK